MSLPQPFTIAAVLAVTTVSPQGNNDVIWDGLTVGRADLQSYYGTNYVPRTVVATGGSVIPNDWISPSFDILVATYDGASSKFRRNGFDVEVGTLGTSGLDGFTLGALADGTRASNIDVAEVLIAPSLSPMDLTALENYWSMLYNIPLPAGAVERRILFDGDSLTVGFGPPLGQINQHAWPTKVLAALGQPYVGRNMAIAGQTAFIAALESGLSLFPYYDPSLPVCYGVALLGYNDAGTYGASARVTANRVKWWHNMMQARGFRTIACTPYQHKNNVAPAAALIRAEASTYSDGLCDLEPDTRLQDTTNPTYYVDEVHNTDAGYTIVATALTSTLSATIASPPPRLTPPPSGTLLASDTFAATAGAPIDQRLLDTAGGNWEYVAGNKDAVIAVGGGMHTATDDAYMTNGGQPDQTVEFTYQLDSSGSYAIMWFRCGDNANNWQIHAIGNGQLALYEVTANVSVSRGAAVWTFDTNPHTLKVVCSGTSITVYLDTVQMIHVTSASFRYNVGVGVRSIASKLTAFTVKQS
jgi:hypothetical protein